MAVGRMSYNSESIMQLANFTFVLPNDVYMDEVEDPRHYERPAKSLILLHGLTGTDTDWLYGGMAQEMSRQYNLAIFMPTTGNSFYLDRGYSGGNYGTFVGEEFPAYIRKVFGYCGSREDTMIGGLSMGGYGALHTALAYPETFSACIALSSALIVRGIADGTHEEVSVTPPAMTRDLFGDPEKLLASDKNPEFQLAKLQAENRPVPKIYMAIGTEDSLLPTNREFRDVLEASGTEYIYEEGPGIHNWTFWNTYLNRALSVLLR